MSQTRYRHALSILLRSAFLVGVTVVFVTASARPVSGQSTFKVAFFNIQSGKGEPALPGRTRTFSDTTNCTDTSKPLNAWGVGIIQRELTAVLGRDTNVVALGLAEAWTCASAPAVRAALGWKAASSQRNGVGMVARYGFAGPESWQQLDTSLNDNAADTMWVLRVPVCLDSACNSTYQVATAHWYASAGSPDAMTTYDRQAAETVDFLSTLPAGQPHLLMGDLNVWESNQTLVCGQPPMPAGLGELRRAGYIDAWPHRHGTAEGFTGMTNRAGCGSPEGYAWKRLDYIWSSPGVAPVSITRFAVVPGGEEAPSDHYGLLAEYPRPGATPPPSGPPASGQLGPGDVVMYAAQASRVAGNWQVVNDSTAASARAIQNPDRGAAKLLEPLAAPVDFFEATFNAERGRAYHLWVRGKAAGNSWRNDSVYVQFSGSVTSSGASTWRIGTASATTVSIEQCSDCGLAAWGWSDNGWASLGAPVYFAQTGVQTIRVQAREDGITIDQIVLSPELYLADSPGLAKNDATIMPLAPDEEPPPASALEIVKYAADATRIAGAWTKTTDASAAGGVALRNPDRGAAKLAAPLASPADYFEVTFTAEAGRDYRVWLRGKADNDHYANDSAYLQFSGSVTSSGAATWRIGTTSGTWVGIEDCSGCGLDSWGWQDNGYGTGVLGTVVRFQTTGTQTLRIQRREDGLTIDQIVISANRYLTARPGATKNDTTILPR